MVSYVEKRELNMQKSVQVIVPMKSVKAGKREGLDGYNGTDITYPKFKDGSCSHEVTCWRIGRKPKAKQGRLEWRDKWCKA